MNSAKIPDPETVSFSEFQYNEEEIKSIVKDLPETLDLRTQGIITSVKNQGYCGSCWTFGTVAAVEGAYALSHEGKKKRFSEQSVIDCSWAFGNDGCGGGYHSHALDYIIKYGLPMDSDYGDYQENEGVCHVKNITEVYKVKGYRKVTATADALKVALNKFGPVVAIIEVTLPMQLYSNGIFHDDQCTGHQNHAVAIVGYGVGNGIPFWLVKNSWGSSYGEAGYIRVSAVDDKCGLLSWILHIE